MKVNSARHPLTIKHSRRGLKIVLGIVIVLALIHGMATFVLGRMVEARIQAYKAQGDPVSTADLAGPSIPDSENGGVIYNQVQVDLRAFRKQDAKRWKASLKNVPHDPKLEDYESRAQELLKPNTDLAFPSIWEAARRYVLPVHDMLPKLEEAASKPKCRFKTNWQDGPVNVMFPYLAGMRELSRTLGVAARLDAHDGKMDEATRILVDAFKTADCTRDEPSLIAMLVRSAMMAINSRSLLGVTYYRDFDKAQARKLYDVLSGIEMGDQSVLAMKSERFNGIWIFKTVATQGGHGLLSVFGYLEEQQRYSLFFDTLSGSYLWRPFLYADELKFLDVMDRAVEEQKLPWRKIATDGYVKYEDEKLPAYAVFTGMLTPVFSKAQAQRDCATATISGDQIFLALIAYKESFHSYPTTLTELRSKLGWKINEDPFTGKDFVYRRDGNGFLLYSIGANMKDDGGRGNQTGDRRKTGNSDDDDIAWFMDH